MTRHFLVAAILGTAACSGTRSAGPLPLSPTAPSADLITIYDAVRVPGLEDRRFNHATYWRAVTPYLGGSVTTVTEGTSAEGREIRHLSFGSGETTVLLWSQMHGNESTASMA
ncbi:MAG: hypothetical protein O7B77_08255, partial [Actinobacteria bacterium]|nr:hypothetical protein [Actinomycetota bacterium]